LIQGDRMDHVPNRDADGEARSVLLQSADYADSVAGS
jgi:hypothetical protein